MTSKSTIIKRCEMITALYHSKDDRVTVIRGKEESGTEISTDAYERWWNLIHVVEVSDTNESLRNALEQLEIVYGLSRDN